MRTEPFTRRVGRVDWPSIVKDLEASLGMRPLSRMLGVPNSTLWGWRSQGYEPSFHDGEALIAFWAQQTGRLSVDAPRYG